jgi:solute carrier family 35 protein F1/2
LESHHHGTTSLTAANAANHLLLPPAKWYYYFAVAFVEAQAFYFIFLAFRYTSFTFVYVSDALAIPSAMVFSRLFMRRKYLWTHILGCFICITGIVVNTASDINNDAQNSNGGGGGGGLNDVLVSLDHVKGDIFAIFGAVLLGLDDVLSEMILDNYRGGVSKMLFMKGMFGALISLIQLGMFERDNVYLLFGVDDEGGDDGAPCDFSWRMMLLSAHVVSRALGVAGEMQFLFISEA